MIIYGVAVLAACMLIGVATGDLLGSLLGVKANVGGVGIAMLLLIAARIWLVRARALTDGLQRGVEFWGALYIPIVVAMAANQDVVSAAESGPLVLIAGCTTVLLCFGFVAFIGRFGGPTETMDEIEAREHLAAVVARSDPA